MVQLLHNRRNFAQGKCSKCTVSVPCRGFAPALALMSDGMWPLMAASAQDLGNLQPGKRHFQALFALSTAKKPRFGGRRPYLGAKYNMLWFRVDMPYRQRYFCICGCKQAFTLGPAQALQQKKNQRSEKAPVFPFAARLIPP